LFCGEATWWGVAVRGISINAAIHQSSADLLMPVILTDGCRMCQKIGVLWKEANDGSNNCQLALLLWN